MEKQVIRLGSGDVYIDLFTGALPEFDALLTQMKTEEKRLGYISGGGALEYKPEFYDASDDMGYVIKSTITKEDVAFKTGILTFTGNTLQKLCATGRVTEDIEKKRRILKIGGIANQNNGSYVILFHHKDKVDGDVHIIIVGSNQAGFSLAFQKDKETVIDAEFKAKPQDSEGTLIQYVEEIKDAPTEATAQTVAVKAPATK